MIERDVVIACDFPGEKEMFDFLDLFNEEKPFVKIGMELFYSAGPQILSKIKARGHKVFLDLKLHDIPNTVKRSMAVLAEHDIDMTNLHAAGTCEMMRAAVEGLTRPGKKRTILLAVTQLTSTGEDAMKKELLVSAGMEETVLHYANNARISGLDGVVCSPWEAAAVKDKCGAGFVTLTPGIRFADGERGDQVRVCTPAEAKKAGSDFIVVGRPITSAQDPVEAYRRCCREFLG